jgi:hypothetical protein
MTLIEVGTFNDHILIYRFEYELKPDRILTVFIFSSDPEFGQELLWLQVQPDRSKQAY